MLAVSATSSIVFTPLTDTVAALGGVADASISIGALTVQPGGTGVILAGTGDPNDVLDSYYGAGILRSTDGGNTWSLIQQTVDEEEGLGARDSSFVGRALPALPGAPSIRSLWWLRSRRPTKARWWMPIGRRTYARVSTTPRIAAQPGTWPPSPTVPAKFCRVRSVLSVAPGNAATAVVWNPVRQLFVAAVRYHGYYQSPDGITWTRMAAQPGAGLTAQMCPTNYTGRLAPSPAPSFAARWP